MTNPFQKSATVTLERTGYEELMAKASLLDDIFEHLPEFALPAELYSKKRITEFRQMDKISPALKKKAAHVLRN